MTHISEPPKSLNRTVFQATVVVISTLAGAYLIWLLADLFLLFFACALVAMILLTLTNEIRCRVTMPFGVALGVTVIGLLTVLIGAFVFFGATLSAEFNELAQRLPSAWARLQVRLGQSTIGAIILERGQDIAPDSQRVVDIATSAFSTIGGAVSGLLIVLVGGLYLAAQPVLYGVGLLRLIPQSMRVSATGTLDALTVSLQAWLKGQALGMIFVGFTTGIGLTLIGVPAAPAIGIVAGLGEFVPYLGVVVAGVPAVILGFAQSSETGLWTLGLLIMVQQVQGNLVMPLLQNQMVDLPPALTIFGIIAAGILFGFVGILLATPLTVVVLVLIRRLYLHEHNDEAINSSVLPSSSLQEVE